MHNYRSCRTVYVLFAVWVKFALSSFICCRYDRFLFLTNDDKVMENICFHLTPSHGDRRILPFMVHHPTISPQVPQMGAKCRLQTDSFRSFSLDITFRWHYLTSYHIIPFCVRLTIKWYLSSLPLQEKSINFSTLLSLDKFLKHEIRSRFIT